MRPETSLEGQAIAGDEQVHAPLWCHGKTIDLGTVGQDPCSEAWGINEDRQIVGVSFPCWDYGSGRAFLWGGPMVDLNALLENPSDLHLYAATYVSDRGEIVAQGVLPDGDIHTAVLVPHGHCGGLRAANRREHEHSGRSRSGKLDDSSVGQTNELVTEPATPAPYP
jgi:probable HAF family extracellular repeat protein